jgi:DNA-directed RNA polymerase specialized sigma24 family protein
MSSPRSKECTATTQTPGGDEELLDAFDEMVLAASRGDRRAIGCLAIAYVTPLIDEARAALGPMHEQEAAEVVQEFLLGLAEGRFTCPRIRGGAISWMNRVVRALATDHVARVGGMEAA